MVYLIIYNVLKNESFIKYFNNEYEKNKFSNKIKFSKKLFIIEDSSDTDYHTEEEHES